MPHPYEGYVEQLLQSYLSEDSDYEGWSLSELQYDHYSETYKAGFSQGQSVIRIKIPTELIDTGSSTDPFKAKRLRKTLKKTLVKESSAS